MELALVVFSFSEPSVCDVVVLYDCLHSTPESIDDGCIVGNMIDYFFPSPRTTRSKFLDPDLADHSVQVVQLSPNGGVEFCCKIGFCGDLAQIILQRRRQIRRQEQWCMRLCHCFDFAEIKARFVIDGNECDGLSAVLYKDVVSSVLCEAICVVDENI